MLSLNKKLDEIAGVTVSQETAITYSDPGESSDLVEKYLAEFFHEEGVTSADDSCSNDALLADIAKLESRAKINVCESNASPGTSKSTPKPFDILSYWKQRRYTNPRVYRLAREVLAIPSTQVTVERLFSQLKFVMQDNRMRLSDQSVKDLMLLKMNPDLLPMVAEIIAAEK